VFYSQFPFLLLKIRMYGKATPQIQSLNSFNKSTPQLSTKAQDYTYGKSARQMY